jgi:hypothetical protein
MGKLKFWVFALVVTAIGGLNLYLLTRHLVRPTLEGLDRGARSAAALLETREQLALRGMVQAVEAGARAAQLGPADKPNAAVLGAATQAVAAKAQALGLGDAGLVVLASGSGLARYRAGESNIFEGTPSTYPFLVEAMEGNSRQGYAQVGEGLWRLAAGPVGRGAAILVGYPLDSSWVVSQRAALTSDVSLAFDGKVLVSTLGPEDTRAAAVLAKRPLVRASGMGVLGKMGKLPIPLLFVDAPAHRVLGVPLGVEGVQALVSLPAREALTPLASYQQFYLVALLALVIVGISLGFTAGDETRMERPAPRKAEARAPAEPPRPQPLPARDTPVYPPMEAQPPPPPPPPQPNADPGAGRVDNAWTAPPPPAFDPPPPPSAPPPIDTDPSTEALPPWASAEQEQADPFGGNDGPRTQVMSVTPGMMAEAGGAPAENGFVNDATADASLLDGDDDDRNESTVVAQVPEALLRATSRAPVAAAPPPMPMSTTRVAPAGAVAEEAHWHEVFQDFVKTRGECGEPSDGLTFDRFKAKLLKNREQLVQKYSCKSVRFQVYVKDGKAALKATPVRA